MNKQDKNVTSVDSMADMDEDKLSYHQAKSLLGENRPIEAMPIIKKYEKVMSVGTEEGRKWLDLLITALEKTFSVGQLISLYQNFPTAFDTHEDAAILIGQTYLRNNRTQDFNKIRESWKGKETYEERWFALDADKLLVEGRNDQAEQMLKSREFDSTADADRLLRLAQISFAGNKVDDALNFLDQAITKDPVNPSIRVFKASIYENQDCLQEALAEYVAAVQNAPNNIMVQDQLAEFYQRHFQYNQSLQIWVRNLTPPSQDYIWLKTLFWSRVVTPVRFNWKDFPVPEGALKPLVEYMLTIDSEEFWNDQTFVTVPNAQMFVNTQFSVYWLRLIQALKEGKELDALQMLQSNPFKNNSWDPKLENALQRVLTFRKLGKLEITEEARSNIKKEDRIEAGIPRPPMVKWKHEFFDELESLALSGKDIPKDIKDVLMSDEAFAVIFLAAGWNQAALELLSTEIIPENFPDWISFGFTQAIFANRGRQKAIEFAEKQKKSSMQDLIISELFLLADMKEKAIKNLEALLKDSSVIGTRAAWLMSLHHIENKDYEKARKAITSNQTMANDIIGKEVLARISRLEGNTDEAAKLYNEIVDDSVEAKLFLSQKAMDGNDWSKAKELTENLLLQLPFNTGVIQKLQRILQEEKKATLKK